MKKSLLAILLVLATVLTAQANPVEQQKAQQLANQFLTEMLSAQPNGRRAAAQLNLTYKDLGFSHLYTFADEAGGFVVVAGDDRVDPVLAYSTTDVLDPGRMPESMQIMLMGYDLQIGSLPQGVPLRHRSASPQRKVIAPLIKTMWHQDLPLNYNCPFDTNENMTAPVGCVALALAQLMNYYQYPAATTTIPAYTTGTGYNMPALEPTTFDYSKLHINYPYVYGRDEVDASDPSIQEIAKLMLYAGCALQMNYAVGGSSSIFDIDLIAKYFGFDKKCRRLAAGNYPHDVWEEMVYNELAAGRPVPYSGGAFHGQNHMFIIDGYDGDGYFHANLGEANDNVYYKLAVINHSDVQNNPNATSGYNFWQTGYFGFQPDKGNDALPKVDFNYGDYALAKSDYTRSGANADFQDVVLKAEMERYDMNSLTVEYGWGLFQNGLMKQVAGYASTNQQKASADMKLTFGSTLADGVYQFYPVIRYQGATEWESYREFGYTDENSNPLRHYTATIQGNSLHVGVSSLDPHITIDKVEYYSAYVGKKMDLRAFLTNGGTNYENHLFAWIDGELKAGVGVYVDPGKSGQADFSIAAPTSKGVHAIKITTDDKGNAIIYNGQVTITDVPNCTLEGEIELKGAGENNTIFKNCTVNLTVKNTGTTTFDNLIKAEINKEKGYDEVTGNLIIEPENGIPSVPWRRAWYLHLEPGESTTVSFNMGECILTEGFNHTLLTYYFNQGFQMLRSKKLNYVDYIPGDANGDGLVNVTDIVSTVNFIMEKNPAGFNKKAADLTGDGTVNVTDIVKMVNIIMASGARRME